jgi:glycosyltransferase involved in cell wall biosynthesis
MRDGVVMAARIEPLKNQLRLIQACAAISVPLTLVGTVHPHHRGYGAACRRVAGPKVRFVEHVSQEELASVFHQAAVHALPSWFETTGLSSLEAGLSGCALVVSERGYAAEYFKGDAEYCDPGSVASIRHAIEAAFRRGPSTSLRHRIETAYSWDRAAEATLSAYDECLVYGRPSQA